MRGVYIMIDIREEQWRYVSDNVKYRRNIHALGWGVYTKDKEELIKSFFGGSSASERGEHCLNLCEG